MLTDGIVVSLRRMFWTFASVERSTSQRYPHIVWKLSTSRVRWTARERACASNCARDLRWTIAASVAFTDVRTLILDTGTARSYTKSEYAQSLGDPKGTLFDTNIECRRHTGTGSGGVVTSLFLVVYRYKFTRGLGDTFSSQFYYSSLV